MNMKRMTVSIVTAMMVMTMFAVMIGPAAAFDYSIGKSTLTEPGGTIDNSLEYNVGQQVNYSMTFTPTSESCTITSAKDIFPDGSDQPLPGIYPISLDKDEVIGWETTWVVNGGGIRSDGTIVNYLEVEGYDADCNPFIATAPKSSNIIVDISFTFTATCCEGATVTPEWSGPVAWHQWILDGPGPVVNTAPVPLDITSCGWKSITLKGGPDIGNLANYKEFSDTIYIACEPIVEVKTNVIDCVRVGDPVEFSIDSLTNDTPIASYQWTFTNGLASSNNPTVTRHHTNHHLTCRS
jgi:hypothetical protein